MRPERSTTQYARCTSLLAYVILHACSRAGYSRPEVRFTPDVLHVESSVLPAYLTESVTLVNTGVTPLSSLQFAPGEGIDASVIDFGGDCPSLLKPGTSCTVTIGVAVIPPSSDGTVLVLDAHGVVAQLPVVLSSVGAYPLFWLDASVGLYSDESGTTPADYDGDLVHRWDDRMQSGVMFSSPAGAVTTLNKLGWHDGMPAVHFEGPADGGATSVLLSNRTFGVAPRTFASVGSFAANTDYWQYVYSSRCATCEYDPKKHTDLVAGGPGVADQDLAVTNSDGGRMVAYPSTKVVLGDPLVVAQTDPSALGDYRLALGGSTDNWIPLRGDIAEVLMYGGELSETEVDLVMSYLVRKYFGRLQPPGSWQP